MRIFLPIVAVLATSWIPTVISQEHALFVKRDAIESGKRVTRQTSADQMVQNILQWLQGVYTQNSRRIRQGTLREYLPPSNTQRPRPFQPVSQATNAPPHGDHGEETEDVNYIGYPPSGITPQPGFPPPGNQNKPGYPSPPPDITPPISVPDYNGGGYPKEPPPHPEFPTPGEQPGYPITEKPGYPVTEKPVYPVYPTEKPGFPTDRPGFPTVRPEYPTERPEYPTEKPSGYPTEKPAGYPTERPGYPTDKPSYPTDRPGFPTDKPGFPTDKPEYPTPGYPTERPGYPITDKPEYPNTEKPTYIPPVEGSTGYPPAEVSTFKPFPTGPPPTLYPETTVHVTYPPKEETTPYERPTYPPTVVTQPPPTQPPVTYPPVTRPPYTKPPYTSGPHHTETTTYQAPGEYITTKQPVHPDENTVVPTPAEPEDNHPGESGETPGKEIPPPVVTDEDLKHPPHIHAIDVECAKDMMTINIEFNRQFDGVIYSKGFHNNPDCRYVKENSGDTKYKFTVSLNSCGTEFINAFDTQGQSYLENVLVLQNEPGIQEVWDTIRAVRCLWEGNLNKALSVALSVGMLNQEIVTFSGDTAMAMLDIQLGKGPFAPPANGLVKIGEIMTLVVSVTGDPGFDIQVKDCRAKDSSGENEVALTDDNGCVLKPKLFGAFQKTRQTGNTGASIIAYAFFNAFKFPDVMDLMIECNVELCKTDCEVCPDPDQKLEPGRRRRRDISAMKNNETLGEPVTMGKLLRVILPEDLSDSKIINITQEDRICMTMHSFVIASALLISLLCCSSLFSAYMWLKNQRHSVKH